ncbi:MAG: ATP-binding cassette domain-containing protein [Planctomycetes bacterium]|nr:ATP-binding cassette domain-containing protein [Planctomycetota bacterium]
MIETDALVHAYGDRRALDGVTFEVRPREIFGLLGPNGGGKTTLFRILSTLLKPSGGRARVLGHDTVAEAAAVRRGIGVVFQSPSLDRKLTAFENLYYQAQIHGFTFRETKARAREMLARVGLAERAGDVVEKLSGGMRRRVELAKGMLHRPKLLLLDEPSTGLDPGGRRDLWTYLASVRDADGVTSLVTTHLMEEAERCDRVLILDRGRVVALGAPAELVAQVGGDVLTLDARDPEALAAEVRQRMGLDASVVEGRVRIEQPSGHELIPKLVQAFPGRIDAVRLGRPTLEDVFIRKTGHRFWSEEEGGGGGR